MFIKPDEVADPVCMRIAGNYNIVIYFVVIESLKRSVSIRLVPILVISRVSGSGRS